jgi:hypothetical protein
VTGVQTCALPILLGDIAPQLGDNASCWATSRLNQIGRASCRERVYPVVVKAVGAVSFSGWGGGGGGG